MYEHSDIGKIQDKEIYILHYLKGDQNLKYSQGKMMKNKIKNGLTFKAEYASKWGSSGAPVIYSEQKLVIGMHRGYLLKNPEIKNIVIIKDVVNKILEEKKQDIEKSLKNSNIFYYSDYMKMDYIIPKEKNIKFFGEKFIERYEREKECKIIYNNEEYALNSTFEHLQLTEEDKKKGEIRIKLKGITLIKKMSYMFYRCKYLKKVDASETDMRNVVKMRSVFERCERLEELSDVSFWNLENVRSLRGMFYKCKSLRAIPGMNKWYLKKLKNCYEMFFACCSSLSEQQIAQIDKWEDVPQEKKVEARFGYDIKGFFGLFHYALIKNFDGTAKNFFDVTSHFFEF